MDADDVVIGMAATTEGLSGYLVVPKRREHQPRPTWRDEAPLTDKEITGLIHSADHGIQVSGCYFRLLKMVELLTKR